MKYYLIAGEASGDLHASHLMAALKDSDPEASFRFIGGDKMAAVGGELVHHYRNLAYMGIVPVLLHLRTILRTMRQVKRDIEAWQPDALILIDYPGFNLKIAKHIHRHTAIPTFYYISPKIWAWKEYRIKAIRRDIDHMLSILPFEVDFYEGKHHYPIHYVGNPTVDEVSGYLADNPKDHPAFCRKHNLPEKSVIALLAGSRKQEITANLPIMLQAAAGYAGEYNIVLAAAPGIDDDFYARVLSSKLPSRLGRAGEGILSIVRDATYPLLQHSTAALVTSGTATLETAVFGVPQVVCYKIPKLYGWLRPYVLKIRHVSLVNLIADRALVPELLADLNVSTLRRQLASILPGGAARPLQLAGYQDVARRLGTRGAAQTAAQTITAFCRHSYEQIKLIPKI